MNTLRRDLISSLLLFSLFGAAADVRGEGQVNDGSDRAKLMGDAIQNMEMAIEQTNQQLDEKYKQLKELYDKGETETEEAERLRQERTALLKQQLADEATLKQLRENLKALVSDSGGKGSGVKPVAGKGYSHPVSAPGQSKPANDPQVTTGTSKPSSDSPTAPTIPSDTQFGAWWDGTDWNGNRYQVRYDTKNQLRQQITLGADGIGVSQITSYSGGNPETGSIIIGATVPGSEGQVVDLSVPGIRELLKLSQQRWP